MINHKNTVLPSYVTLCLLKSGHVMYFFQLFSLPSSPFKPLTNISSQNSVYVSAIWRVQDLLLAGIPVLPKLLTGAAIP